MITPNQFAALALRVFALWLFFSAAQIGLLTWALQRSGQENGAVSYALAALYMAGSLLLWKFPLVLAARIVPKAAAEEGTLIEASGAVTVAFVSAGLLIIALKALTAVALYLSLLSMLLISGQAERMLVPSMHIDGIVGLLMLATGLVLIVKGRVLAALVLSKPA